jgi:hypothetical protein
MAIPLLLLWGLLAVVDLFFLTIAIGFGPEGLGGDGSVSSGRAAVEHSGIVAGFVGLAVAAAAPVAFLGLLRHTRRNRVLAWLVGAQALMLICVLASMWS